jgi:hypothetical protein
VSPRAVLDTVVKRKFLSSPRESNPRTPIVQSVAQGYHCNVILKNAYKILVANPLGKRPRGKYRRRWDGNIRIDLGEIRWEGLEWMHLAQDRDQRRAVMKTVMTITVP